MKPAYPITLIRTSNHTGIGRPFRAYNSRAPSFVPAPDAGAPCSIAWPGAPHIRLHNSWSGVTSLSPAAEVACAPGGLCVLQELGNRSGQLGVTHRRDGRSQCAAPEPADDLLVLAVVPPGNELSNASQQ